VDVLASVLKKEFDPLVDVFVPCLLKLCGRANKVFVSRASTALQKVLQVCLPLRLFPKLQTLMQQSTNKNVVLIAATAVQTLIIESAATDLQPYLDVLTVVLQAGLKDASSDVRVVSFHSFQHFQSLFSDKANQ
jgi:CLASP N terminal